MKKRFWIKKNNQKWLSYFFENILFDHTNSEVQITIYMKIGNKIKSDIPNKNDLES